MAQLVQSAIDLLDGMIADGPTDADTSNSGVRNLLRSLFNDAIRKAFPDAPEEAAILACNQAKFGDYQCNNAMALHGRMKGQEGALKSPRAVAEALLAQLPDNPLISETSLAGPGFINIRINHTWLEGRIAAMLIAGAESWAPRVSQRVIVDFSSPNVAKEMHVGHLRSTILGDTISRTLEFCGADVLRLNHIGDWGTQFGMLITYMMDERAAGTRVDGEGEAVSDLMALYKASKLRFDADEDFKKRSQEAVTTLQSGDPESLAMWRRICGASRLEFDAIYSRLGIKITERGESFYNPTLKDTIAALAETGIVEDSDGAKVIWTCDDRETGYPLMVQKRDGGFGYASTDMAAIRQRTVEEKADWIIVVTDIGQAGHFDMIFKAARMAGWLPPAGEGSHPRVDHVGFGLVLGDDGKRFRTRSSEVVKLVDLLDEAKNRCKANLMERRLERGDPMSEEESEAAACAMGYGAVKYADLKNARLTNYKFSFDEMLNMKGNTAVYLLYAHARIAGIVRKSGQDVQQLATTATIKLDHRNEVALGLHIARFPEAVEATLTDLMPNRLTEYLYALSESFNSFYTECKVLGSEQESSRLLLCESTAVIMRACFHLLGLTPLYRI